MADEKNTAFRSSIRGEDIEKELDSRPRPTIIANVREFKQVDEAMHALTDYEGAGEAMDEATSRRLLRKIDMNIMPVCRRRRVIS